MSHRKNTANAPLDRRWKQLTGRVFRRKDLVDQLPSVDRELALAVKAGTVRKAAQGLYYVPQRTPFGDAPPSEEALVEKFLDDRHFLMFNPSCYNALGLGTTQLYSTSSTTTDVTASLPWPGLNSTFATSPAFPRTSRSIANICWSIC